MGPREVPSLAGPFVTSSLLNALQSGLWRKPIDCRQRKERNIKQHMGVLPPAGLSALTPRLGKGNDVIVTLQRLKSNAPHVKSNVAVTNTPSILTNILTPLEIHLIGRNAQGGQRSTLGSHRRA